MSWQQTQPDQAQPGDHGRDPAASSPTPATAATPAPPPTGIATLPAAAIQPVTPVPTNPRTGEPARPAVVWIASLLLFGGAAVAAVGLILVLWNSVDNFPEAAWLNGLTFTGPGDGIRVLMAMGGTAIGVLVAASSSVVGYYAFQGYGWARIGGLVAAAVSLLSLMLTPVAAASIAFAVVGAGLLWLPPVRRFFAAWGDRRELRVPYSPPVERVHYGPLQRFR